MQVGDVLKINENYADAEPGTLGTEVRVIVYDKKKVVFPIDAEVLTGEYAGETWFFLENELS